jgi:hypothetical protein
MKIRLILLAILAFFALSSCDPDAGAEGEPLAFGQQPLRPNIPTWTVLVTWEVQSPVKAPQALPDGYISAFRYTYPLPLKIQQQTRPEAHNISFIPDELEGLKYKVSHIRVIGYAPPSRGEEPAEELPDVEGSGI